MNFFKALPLILLSVSQVLAAPVGRFASVDGDVTVDGESADVGTTFELGAVIETGSGKCTLLLGKTSVIHLDSDSKLKVTQHLIQANGEEASAVDLHHGRTRALVRNSGGKRIFRIRTRAAVMGVRGTHIYVDSPREKGIPAQFITIEGSADLELARPGTQIQKLTLAANQAFTSQSATKAGVPPIAAPLIREISVEKAKDMAATVAPPPREVRRPEDTVKPDKEAKPKPKGPKGPGVGARPPIPGGQLPVDPVRDSPKVEVKVRITGRRAP